MHTRHRSAINVGRGEKCAHGKEGADEKSPMYTGLTAEWSELTELSAQRNRSGVEEAGSGAANTAVCVTHVVRTSAP